MQVHIEMSGQERQMFHALLREGVEVQVRLGATVQEISQEDLHIPECMVEQEIQSIFLNNHPVDDLDTRVQTPGSVLSLSAAMPGLVGACMRRDGAYAGLRQGISWADQKKDETVQTMDWVSIKLFNFMTPRIGPILLALGVQVGGERLAQVLKGLSAMELETISSVRMDEEAVEVDDPQILEKLAGQGSVWLQVITHPDHS